MILSAYWHAPSPIGRGMAAMAPVTLRDWLPGTHFAGRMLVAAYSGNVCAVGKDPGALFSFNAGPRAWEWELYYT